MKSNSETLDVPNYTRSSNCRSSTQTDTIEFIDAVDSTTLLASVPPGVSVNSDNDQVTFTTTSTTLADINTALGRPDFIVRHTRSVENYYDST